MPLLQSSSFKATNQTLHKTALPGENYVLSLTPIANFYAASASSPSNQIHLFDRATLQTTGVLKGHEHATTQLCTIRGLGSSTREMLLSSGKDGCVIAWDERSGSAGITSASSTSVSPDNMYLYNSENQWKRPGHYTPFFVAMHRLTVCSLLLGLTCKKRMRSSCTGQPCIEVRTSHRHLICPSFHFKGSTESSSTTALSWLNPL